VSPRERSFGANAILSWGGWLVPAVVAFVAVPITVRGLGDSQYGLLALTASLTGYLGLMEMGLGSAIMRYLSYYCALNEGRPMLGVIRFALTWFSVAGLIGGVFLWVAAPWLATSVLKVPPDLVATAVPVLRLTGVSFLLGLIVSVGPAIPQSFLRYDIASAVRVTLGTLSAAGPAVIVTLGYGLIAVVSFSIVVSVVAIIVYGVIGIRLLRHMALKAGPPWKEIRRKTLSFAGMSALNSVGSVVSRETNRLVVDLAIGVAAVAYYQVPYVLASRVSDLLTAVAQVLFPTASAMLARDDHEGVQRLYVRTSRLFFLVNFAGSVGLCVFAYPLLQYWVSDTYAREGAVALALFAMGQAIHSATMSASYVNLAAARPAINLVFSTMGSVISLAVMYPFTVRWGVSGAAAAFLVSAANVPWFLQYSQSRVLQLSSWTVWRRCYQPTVIGSALSAVVGYFLLLPLCRGLLSTLVLWFVFMLLVFLVSGVLGAVSREDLQTANRMAAAVWHKVWPAHGR
jgi:Membrane protein involved in the export of O-antigen and teichoic acid